MTPQQLLAVAVRLFAVWLALTSVSYFFAIPAALANASMGTNTPTHFAYAVGTLYLLCALLLWFLPMLVAHKLLPRTHHTDVLNPHGHDLARAGCGLLGLWLLSRSLPNVVWLFFKAVLFASAGSTVEALPVDTKVELAVAIFELGMGLLLLMKTRTFAELLFPKARASSATSDDA